MRVGLDLCAQLHRPGVSVPESNVRRRSRVHIQLYERRPVHRVDVRAAGVQFQLLTLAQPKVDRFPGNRSIRRREPLSVRSATAGDARH